MKNCWTIERKKYQRATYGTQYPCHRCFPTFQVLAKVIGMKTTAATGGVQVCEVLTEMRPQLTSVIKI